jgi:NADPH-dependent ferric siderophore reductase
MSVMSGLKNKLDPRRKRSARLLTVKDAWYLTPNMIRVTFAGSELEGIAEGCEGANCKLMLPEPGELREHFATRLANGPKPVTRTFTVRHYSAERSEMSIDFVAHGDNGPASGWATKARPGDFLGFAGPGTPKVTHFEADWYLVAADPSAIPVAAATLEAMPRDAKGVAIFEVTSAEDQQDIDMPAGIDAHWLVHANPQQPSTAQESALRAIDWPDGRVQTCIAGESGVVRALKSFVLKEKQVAKQDAYISGYWKIGLIEDEHQQLKRSES